MLITINLIQRICFDKSNESKYWASFANRMTKEPKWQYCTISLPQDCSLNLKTMGTIITKARLTIHSAGFLEVGLNRQQEQQRQRQQRQHEDRS